MGRPFVKGMIVSGPLGERRETALLDTGSHVTIIAEHTAKGAGYDCGPDDEPTSVTVLGREIPACVRRVRIRIDGSECDTWVNAYVAKDALPGTYSHILGADFAAAAGLRLDMRRNRNLVQCGLRQPGAPKEQPMTGRPLRYQYRS